MSDNEVLEPPVIDVYGDGAVTVTDVDVFAAVPTEAAVNYARRGAEDGRDIVLRGSIRSRMGRPVVEAVRAAVPAVRVERRRQRRPEGWLMLDFAFGSRAVERIAADLLDRVERTNSYRSLIKLGTKYCRPDAVRELRRAAGRSGPPTAPGSGPDAVSLQVSSTEFVGIFVVFLLPLWVFMIHGTATSDDVSLVALVVGMVLSPILVGVFVAVAMWGNWERTCFDGSRMWVQGLTGRLRRRWNPPIDLRNVAAYIEYEGRGRAHVHLLERSINGVERKFNGAGFSDADVVRLEHLAPLRSVGFAVTRSYMYHGIARHLRRHIDLDRLILPERVSIWNKTG